MRSPEYAIGLAFGIITALVIVIIVWKFNKKNMKGQFDERQELVKGKGYKYAFFTTLGLIAVDLLCESSCYFENSVVPHELALFFVILAGVLVYALYCIKNDAYFGVGNDTRAYRAVMWVVIACNAASGFSNLRDGAFENGKLEFGPCASLLFCAAFIVILIALYLKKSTSEEDDAEDAEI